MQTEISNSQWLERAIVALKDEGKPMKISPLSKLVGHSNPRSLSLILQWSKGKVVHSGNRWTLGKIE